VTNAAFSERDVQIFSEGIFFMSDRGVISGVTSFIHEESSRQETEADVDEQGELELPFSMSSFSPSNLTEGDCLLGCSTVYSGRSLPAFQRSLLPPSSGR
jgi:hypothetical protein